MTATKTRTKPILCWHFVGPDRRLGYGDGRLVEASQTFRVKGTPSLCTYGLHGSRKPLDALSYAPMENGIYACRVAISGEIEEDIDKLVGQRRKVLAICPADPILDEFACWCAVQALLAAEVTDPWCWDAIATRRKWLKGEATDSELAAASDAAWDVAWATGAASDAASAAVWATVWATKTSSQIVASAAAWTASDAARATSDAWAARATYNQKLADLFAEAMGLPLESVQLTTTQPVCGRPSSSTEV